jgi:hypothetical protein
MNNRPDHRTRLLAETLDGEWATGPAAAMARRAAAHARRRRTAKRAALSLVGAAAVAAILLLAQRRPASIISSSVAVVATPPAAHPGYEIISDEELIATLRDRPLLVLPQENGPQKIVLLER